MDTSAPRNVIHLRMERKEIKITSKLEAWRKLRGILSKLTPEQFDRYSFEILAVIELHHTNVCQGVTGEEKGKCGCDELAHEFCEDVVAKATMEICHLSTYTNLMTFLHQKNSNRFSFVAGCQKKVAWVNDESNDIGRYKLKSDKTNYRQKYRKAISAVISELGAKSVLSPKELESLQSLIPPEVHL